MMDKPASIGHWLGLLSLVLVGFGGCDRPDAPACLMRAGDWAEIVEQNAAVPRGLKLHDHCMLSSKRGTLRHGIGMAGSKNVLHIGGRVGKATYSKWAMRTVVNGCVTSAPTWS